jgi:hypothetical protein
LVLIISLVERMIMLVGSLPDVVAKVVAPVSKRFSSFGKQIENPEFAPVKDLLVDLEGPSPNNFVQESQGQKRKELRNLLTL